MGEDFSIGLGEEEVTFAFELLTEGAVILNDAIVHQNDTIFPTGMGVGILGGRRAVGGPAGVGDAAGRLVKRALIGVEKTDELADLALGLSHGNLVGSFDSDSGRIIASVFEPLEATEKDGESRT